MSIRPETVALLDKFLGPEGNVHDQLYRIDTALDDLTAWAGDVRERVMDLEPTDELLGALETLRRMENDAVRVFHEAAEEIMRLTEPPL